MKITLDDRYYLVSDDLQWTLFRLGTPKKEGGEPIPVAKGYYKDLGHALGQAWGRMVRDEEEPADLRTENGVRTVMGALLSAADSITAAIKTIPKEIRHAN